MDVFQSLDCCEGLQQKEQKEQKKHVCEELSAQLQWAERHWAAKLPWESSPKISAEIFSENAERLHKSRQQLANAGCNE